MDRKLIQISDLHLFSNPEAVLKNISTWKSFERVLSVIEETHADFDAMIITGDLAHDERVETYGLLKHRLGTLVSRVWLVPGNHDHRISIADTFSTQVIPERETINFHCRIDDWQLLGLDSQLTGETAGVLDEGQLRWLDERLNSSRNVPTLVFLHHPPVAVGSPWLDAIGLKNANDFRKIVEGAGQVHGIFFGHIHQEFRAELGSIACYATPSTGVQFMPDSDTLVVDDRPPGFRVITLGDDTIETHVVRVPID